MENTKRPLLLTNVPVDILNFLLKKQSETKIKKGINQYSLEKIIYDIINNYKKTQSNES